MRLVIPPLCVERGYGTWTVPGPGPCWEIAMNVRFGSKAACQQFNSRAAGYGRGCVKTQNRPLEIVSKLGEFSVEVS